MKKSIKEIIKEMKRQKAIDQKVWRETPWYISIAQGKPDGHPILTTNNS